MNQTFCAIDWEKLVRVLAALLTPVIAIVTSYIAYQQYQTNRRQHRLALFDRRMAVFNSTMNLIAAVLQRAEVDLAQLFALLRETRDHELLFGPEIGEFINEVYKKGLDLNTRAAVAGQEVRRVELVSWFQRQSDVAREKFLKYLDFRRP
jgi:late competence protein required for DNA uptake (superfamily II DNA/RNA helicase)